MNEEDANRLMGLDMLMESMEFFMDKIKEREDMYSELVSEFRTICLNPYVYSKALKKEAFQKLEDTHKELMTLQLKQKSDFKTHKNFLNRELKGHIDESLRVDALKKISKLSKSFGKCMKFQEKTMTEVRNLNDIEIDI
ncbi:MAG: hypothetical protein CME70_05720 [Halobacteriovorax sp.]|nr:hypothetical protein [Halobacteriovorax sp.]|tara:strand:+ start:2709 stop:3125 length:417 start_codon:yes stop_codon:yes gene_type:complete